MGIDNACPSLQSRKQTVYNRRHIPRIVVMKLIKKVWCVTTKNERGEMTIGV